MTVQELINELLKIDNKEAEIIYWDGYSDVFVDEIEIQKSFDRVTYVALR